MQLFSIGFFPPQLRELAGLLFIVVGLVLNLLLALGVYSEASRRLMRGNQVWFVGPGLWSFATFVGGITTAAIYWAMHHSTLAPIESTEPE